MASSRFANNPAIQFQIQGGPRSDVTSVAVWARADSNLAESSNLVAYLSTTTDYKAGTQCNDPVSPTLLGEKVVILCPQTQNVNYVTIERRTPDTGGWITLQEVKIYYDGELRDGSAKYLPDVCSVTITFPSTHASIYSLTLTTQMCPTTSICMHAPCSRTPPIAPQHAHMTPAHPTIPN